MSQVERPRVQPHHRSEQRHVEQLEQRVQNGRREPSQGVRHLLTVPRHPELPARPRAPRAPGQRGRRALHVRVVSRIGMDAYL